jgi:hypothetical protein
MKKSNIFKTVLGVAAAMLISLGASGQVTFVNDDYKQYDSNVLVPDTVDYVTFKAGGTTMGYYAKPDPVFHPNYTAGGGWTLANGFSWNWVVAPVMATAKPGAANYVQITYTAAGNYAVTVAEQSSAAFGGCVDATPTVMNVTVIAPPQVSITTATPANGLCGNQAAVPIAMSFVEAVPQNWAGYAFAVHQTIENIDAANAVIGAAILNADTLDFPTTGKLKNPTLVGGGPTYTWTFNSRPLAVRNGLRTRYTYTLVKASDAPGADGAVSSISQKSDYISGTVNTYPFFADATHFTSYSIVVNPAPATGPIYYIPNNFAY